MNHISRSRIVTGLAAAASVVLVASACSSSDSAEPAPTVDSCPSAPIAVTASVNQWGNIAEQLAGACGTVDTIVTSASGDPHDYEPTTGDVAKFSNARVVVINGMGYDEWAEKAVNSTDAGAEVVDAATVNDVSDGANPHLWYNPDYVTATASAITDAYIKASPDAKDYFDQQQQAFTESMKPYFDEINAIKAGADGKTYGATESVFDYMAEAVGLRNLTPQGYQNAVTNESEPSPGDIAAFNKSLTDKAMKVLINNTQTEGSVPQQLVSTAQGAGVPVVDVTETMPEGASDFQSWQIDQLKELATALGIS